MKKPDVLLLGDSIRMSYQPVVAERLKDRARVVGPEENCQFAAYTLEHLDEWLKRFGRPDLVHWNNGLHDSGHNPARSPAQIPVETYLANLKQILARLRQIGATVLWATTTPVHFRRPFTATDWSWRNEEINVYNAAATSFMESQGVCIVDLHTLVLSQIDDYIVEDGVHLTPAGIDACGRAASDAIERNLP